LVITLGRKSKKTYARILCCSKLLLIESGLAPFPRKNHNNSVEIEDSGHFSYTEKLLEGLFQLKLLTWSVLPLVK